MVRYRNFHGLGPEHKDEHGFDPSLHDTLGEPGRNLLGRLQRHMIARTTKGGKRLYPHVKETKVLDEPTRAVFDKEFPSRPSFAAAWAQIAVKDDKDDSAEYYTQGAMRWQGVRAVYGKVTVGKPPILRGGDCSAGYTRWWLWAWQQSTGRIPHDVVNGCNWRAGYTGSISVVCRRVQTPQVGDAILYGSGTYSHVTGVFDVSSKTCISHGRDRAEIYGWDAHPNRAGFWRPITSNA
jgi:hypothetical protein